MIRKKWNMKCLTLFPLSRRKWSWAQPTSWRIFKQRTMEFLSFPEAPSCTCRQMTPKACARIALFSASPARSTSQARSPLDAPKVHSTVQNYTALCDRVKCKIFISCSWLGLLVVRYHVECIQRRWMDCANAGWLRSPRHAGGSEPQRVRHGGIHRVLAGQSVRGDILLHIHGVHPQAAGIPRAGRRVVLSQHWQGHGAEVA